MLTSLQKKTAQAIVNVFETGSPLGDYGKITLDPDDAGHLTYGRSQTTLASGNLAILIKSYCDAPEAIHAEALLPYLGRLLGRDLSLDGDLRLHCALREAGTDPVMRETQDRFFDIVYWSPAVRFAAKLPVASPLSIAVIYDSYLHGSLIPICDKVVLELGRPFPKTELSWIERYIQSRRNWLASRQSPILRKTVYRMDAFRNLIETNNWNLELPIVIRGFRIDHETFPEL